MNLHRANTEILILAVAAVLVLMLSVSMKAPQSQAVAPQVSTHVITPAQVQLAAVLAAPAALRTVSATTTESEWVRAEAVEAPAKQTRWVF